MLPILPALAPMGDDTDIGALQASVRPRASAFAIGPACQASPETARLIGGILAVRAQVRGAGPAAPPLFRCRTVYRVTTAPSQRPSLFSVWPLSPFHVFAVPPDPEPIESS